MVTWGATTTNFFGTSAPSTPPLTGQAAPSQPPPLSNPAPQATQVPLFSTYPCSSSASSSLPSSLSSVPSQETARIEQALLQLYSQYSPHAPHSTTASSSCAFTAIFYDTSSTAAPTCPPNISSKMWNQALALNPDPLHLTPTALTGSAALHSRLIHCQQTCRSLENHLTRLLATVEYLHVCAQRSDRHLRGVQEEQRDLQRRLLEVMRKVEISRCLGWKRQEAEREGAERLERLRREVLSKMERECDGLDKRKKNVVLAWKRREVEGMSEKKSYFGNRVLQQEEKEDLFHVLNQQRLGMERLGDILKRDGRDVEILKKELEEIVHPVTDASAAAGSAKIILGGGIAGRDAGKKRKS